MVYDFSLQIPFTSFESFLVSELYIFSSYVHDPLINHGYRLVVNNGAVVAVHKYNGTHDVVYELKGGSVGGLSEWGGP